MTNPHTLTLENLTSEFTKFKDGIRAARYEFLADATLYISYASKNKQERLKIEKSPYWASRPALRKARLSYQALLVAMNAKSSGAQDRARKYGLVIDALIQDDCRDRQAIMRRLSSKGIEGILRSRKAIGKSSPKEDRSSPASEHDDVNEDRRVFDRHMKKLDHRSVLILEGTRSAIDSMIRKEEGRVRFRVTGQPDGWFKAEIVTPE